MQVQFLWKEHTQIRLDGVKVKVSWGEIVTVSDEYGAFLLKNGFQEAKIEKTTVKENTKPTKKNK